MSWKRINTVLLHTWFHFTHSMETWVDLFLNSSVQMLVFTFIALYLSGGNSEEGAFMLAGAILWNVIWVGQYSIAIGALWEIWSKSFSNLFITPLTLEEFLAGQMISGIIKSFVSLLTTGLIAYVVYGFSIGRLGWFLPVYFIELTVFSWSLGFFILALIFRYGVSIQAFSWMLIFLIQPLIAVFYPVSVLPEIMQPFSYVFPATYIFEVMRSQLEHGAISGSGIIIGTLLNVVYFIASYAFLKFIYAYAKKTGTLARMEN